MLYTELRVGDDTYKLRLTTKNGVALERALGYNPITMLMEIEKGKMPKLNDIMIMLHAMLQPLHHGITLDKTYEIFDEYALKEGKSMFELIPIFVEVFQNCGYITKADQEEVEAEEAKN